MQTEKQTDMQNDKQSDKHLEKTDHPMVAPAQPFKDSGRENNSRNAPIVSVNPTSKAVFNQDAPLKKEFKIVDGAIEAMFDEPENMEYPFNELEPGQGLFIATELNQTTDSLVEKMHKTVFELNSRYAEVERNAEGDEILEQLTIKTRKRNGDGTIQLSNGKPVTGANAVQLPKLASYRHFVVRTVVKDGEIGNDVASADGVIVIRTI